MNESPTEPQRQTVTIQQKLRDTADNFDKLLPTGAGKEMSELLRLSADVIDSQMRDYLSLKKTFSQFIITGSKS